MKTLLSLALFFVALGTHSFAAVAVAPAVPRTIKDVPEAREALRRTVSPGFYKSLEISPINGWITVRGMLATDHLVGMRVIRSDFGGRYDALALELAKNLQIRTDKREGTLIPTRPVLVHVLVYYIADGNLAVSFAEFDEVGGSQLKYYGSAWMGVEKGENNWVTIEPKWVSPWEKRGPRSYALIVEKAGAEKLAMPRAVGAALGMGAAR
jgi:hypothetical protein